MEKPNHLKIAGMKLSITQQYTALSTKQLQQISNLLQTNVALPTLKLLVLLVLFQLPNVFKRWVLKIYTNFQQIDFIHTVMPYTDFVIKNYYEVPTPYGVLTRKKAMSFIEFIRLHYYFVSLNTAPKEQYENIVCNVLATVFHEQGCRYDDENLEQKAALFVDLHPHLKFQIIKSIRTEFDNLIENNRLIFPSYTTTEQNQFVQNAAKLQEMWFKVARQRAENITKIDEVLHATAEIILFDCNEAIADANEIERKMKEK